MIQYVLSGNLRGLVCSECSEPLSGARARFYRLSPDHDAAAQLVLLDADHIHSKHSRLVGECVTDADGNFTALLDGEFEASDGLELDMYFDTVPGCHSARPSSAAAQFRVTALKPEWQIQVGDLVSSWDYRLPVSFWSSIRERFDAWVICGQVKPESPGHSVEGLKVWAFDRDLLLDDALGPVSTDAEGRFRIDYSSADFRKGEMEIGGPDVYFRIEGDEGVLLLEESPARGRAPERENIGPCFCVELEIGAPLEATESMLRSL
jgi:hypothetical protein